MWPNVPTPPFTAAGSAPPPPDAYCASQSPRALPFPLEAPPPAPGMLGPRGVTQARQLRPLRLWPRRSWGGWFYHGVNAGKRSLQHLGGLRSHREDPSVSSEGVSGTLGTWAGSGAAPVAGPSPASGCWEGWEAARRRGFLGRSKRTPAGREVGG